MSNVETILTKLNIPYKSVKNGAELQYRCICPNHHDTHASAFINTNTGLWHCFSCNTSGNLKSFIRIVSGESVDVSKLITQTDTLKMKLASIYKKSAQSMLIYENDTDFEEHFNIEKNDNFIPAFKNELAKEYLGIKRKLTRKTVNDFNLQFAIYGKYENRIIIPYYDNGHVIGMNSRYIGDCDASYRYRYLINNYRFESYLYNYDNVVDNSYCILVEGPFDLMYMHQCGFKNVISTLNTRVSIGHIRKLVKFKKIIFCFDNDEKTQAGQKAVLKHAETILKILPKANIFKVELPNDKDPNECSPDELHECFRHLKRIRIDNGV